MKKFYLLVCLLGCAFGLSAAEDAIDYSALTWKSVGKAKYKDAILSNIYRWDTNPEITVDVEESNEYPDVFRVITPWPGRSEGNLLIDARDHEMVIYPEQNTLYPDALDGDLWIKSTSSFILDDGGLDYSTFLYQYSYCISVYRDGVIYLPAGGAAFKCPDSQSGMGFEEYQRSNRIFSGYLAFEGHEPVELEPDWVEIGEASMVDGMVSSYLNKQESASAPMTLKVEKFTKRDGIYRFYKPWKDVWPTCTDLLLDVSDPEYGIIPLQSTQIPCDYGSLWISSISAFTSKEVLIAEAPALVITRADNVVTIPALSVQLYFPDYAGSLFINEYSVDTTITLPKDTQGVSDAFTDLASPQAEPEYYSLQGIRLDGPVSGQVVIVRRGDKVTKTFIR